VKKFFWLGNVQVMSVPDLEGNSSVRTHETSALSGLCSCPVPALAELNSFLGNPTDSITVSGQMHLSAESR